MGLLVRGTGIDGVGSVFTSCLLHRGTGIGHVEDDWGYMEALRLLRLLISTVPFFIGAPPVLNHPLWW